MKVSDEVQYKKIIYRLAGSNESWQSAIFYHEPLVLQVIHLCGRTMSGFKSQCSVIFRTAFVVPERGR